MRHIRCLPVILVALAFTSSYAVAQGTGTRAPGGQRGGLSPERLMEYDADGDGKLSRDELPGMMGKRVFERADTNGDDFVDREELEAMFANRGGRGEGNRDGRGPGRRAGGGDSFGAQMGVLSRSMRRLIGSSLDARSLERDLELVAAMQTALIGAKSKLRNVEMSPSGKQKYGTDVAGYHRDFRLHLLRTLSQTLEIERAILEGDSEGARSKAKSLVRFRDEGHALYQPADDRKEKAGRNRDREWGGRGQGQGQGQGRGKGKGTGSTDDD